MVKAIEKAILTSDIGINPSNDGRIIRLVFPELTEERRKDLVKEVKKKGEAGKVAIRNIRRDANDYLKKLGKTEVSEDENQVDENTDSEDAESSSADDNTDDSAAENSGNVEDSDTDEKESGEADESDITDSDSAESTESSEEDAEPEKEMVDRELVIQVGDQSSDGGRYVRVNDSNEIYTISEDSLDTFLGKTYSDFWDLTVSYLSVNNLDTLDVNYEGKDYIVNVSRETSEDESDDTTEDSSSDASDESAAADASTTSTETTAADTESSDDSSSDSNTTSSASVTLSYTLNGNDLDSTTFTTFYNKLINMVGQKRLTDEFKSNTDPELAVKFTDTDGNETDVEYYSYDTNYYAAVTDGKVYLVNKMTVKELFQAFDEVTGKKSDTEESQETESTSESEEIQ